jgi:hypothetical protein
MNPGPLQYFVAKGWPSRIWGVAVGIAGVVLAVVACEPSRSAFQDWRYCLLFVVAVLVAPVLSFFVSLPLAVIFVSPIYSLAARMNGAPFRIGDSVRILSGPYRDRIARVYEIWEPRDQVRLDLDADARKKVTDVFSYTQVCREVAH